MKFVICENKKGTWSYYGKRNKSEKDKYCMILVIYGVLKKSKNENWPINTDKIGIPIGV